MSVQSLFLARSILSPAARAQMLGCSKTFDLLRRQQSTEIASLCRNFFALLALIPLQRCIPLHHQVHYRPFLRSAITHPSLDICTANMHKVTLLHSRLRTPHLTMRSHTSSSLPCIVVSAGDHAAGAHIPRSGAGSRHSAVDLSIRAPGHLEHAEQRRPDGRDHSPAAGRPVWARGPLPTHLRPGVCCSVSI